MKLIYIIWDAGDGSAYMKTYPSEEEAKKAVEESDGCDILSDYDYVVREVKEEKPGILM